MSNATPLVLTAAWRVTPAADRWQTFQSQLSRTTTPESHPWTRRSAVTCSWRAPARVSAAALASRI
jgi:hypothetical protein